jgi:hypothetical protein
MPLDIFMLSGMCAACLLMHGDVAGTKLLVQPESKIYALSVVAIINDGVQSQVNAN